MTDPARFGLARRMFQLVEPIAVVTYMANEPTDEIKALGLQNDWDAVLRR